MKTRLHPALLCFCLLPPAFSPSALAQGTAFTYQGRLDSGGAPANGIYDFTFALYNAPTLGGQWGTTLTNSAVAVSNGLFTTTLDFGASPFVGGDLWLTIGVRTNGGGAFSILSPRQQLTPSPYAIWAGGAQSASSVAAGGVTSVALANGAVTSGAIADGSIGAGDLSPGLLSNTFWRLAGNAGTVSGTHFLGTVDNQSLELRADNQTALRLLPRTTSPSLVGGHGSNTVNSGIQGAFIGGGGQPDSRNLVSGHYAAIVGGYGNRAQGSGSVIGGGLSNYVAHTATVVGGGAGNSAGAPYATIGGGQDNLVLETNGTISGGSGNYLGGTLGNSTIGGGHGNRVAIAQAATIGGGIQHSIGGNSHVATIGGGYQNYIQTNGWGGTIAGGQFNLLTSPGATIAGGYFNVAHGDYAAVGGGQHNQASGAKATIAGGHANSAPGAYSFVGGGTNNLAGSEFSVVGGGQENSISPTWTWNSTIAGGSYNKIRDQAVASTIGGGVLNVIGTNSQWSVIGGGAGNLTGPDTPRAVIGGGQANYVSGWYGVVPGGMLNAATNHAFAAGSAARALHSGAWVWADSDFGSYDTPAEFASTRSNQFLIRAGGGVGINTNDPQATLHVRGNIAADALRAPGAGINTGTFAFIHRAAATNTAGHITTLYHPLTDGDPNAILIVTHNYTADTAGNRYETEPVGLWYNGSRWTIYHENTGVAMPIGRAFNVLVIKP